MNLTNNKVLFEIKRIPMFFEQIYFDDKIKTKIYQSKKTDAKRCGFKPETIRFRFIEQINLLQFISLDVL